MPNQKLFLAEIIRNVFVGIVDSNKVRRGEIVKRGGRDTEIDFVSGIVVRENVGDLTDVVIGRVFCVVGGFVENGAGVVIAPK